ncbi:MAG: hypothetical protein AAGC67_03445 [Myxococcota bacterium]
MRKSAFTGVGVVCLVSLMAATASASGGGGYGGGGGFGGGSVRERTDPAYERGKRVAKGRAPSARGFKVCVAVSSEDTDEDGRLVAKRFSSRSLRPLRATTATTVARRLVDCKDVTASADQRLSVRDLSDLVHYLNKRYKLRL